MDEVVPPRPGSLLGRFAHRKSPVGLILLILVSAVLFVAVLTVNLQKPTITLTILVALLGSVAVLVYAVSLKSRQVHREHQVTNNALEASEEQFRQMAGNIQEVFWIIDPRTKKALYVNEAYEAITGRSCQSLIQNPSSYEDVIHPDDRPWVLSKLEEAVHTGRFDERFRIVTPNGNVRWVWVRGFPVRDSEGKITRLVGTALEISAQKNAEEQVATNLALAKAAWSEEEALRKATLALTQDLRMGSVMDALLRSLADVVPYTCARVLVPEDGPHWLALGERLSSDPEKRAWKPPLTLMDD